MSEVLLHQTQVSRVESIWSEFADAFPTAQRMAAVPVGNVLRQWGRLGYPRRARALWESARVISHDGWPSDLRTLPGVGEYTAAAVAILADNDDAVALDVNVRRVAERVAGTRLSTSDATTTVRLLGRGLSSRDRLLALMDLGALVCTARSPDCGACPLRRRCVTRGPLPDVAPRRQATFAGSFRERRGKVMAALRVQPTPVDALDNEALASLVQDGLAMVRRRRGVEVAQLP